jgi:hypothetical protein
VQGAKTIFQPLGRSASKRRRVSLVLLSAYLIIGLGARTAFQKSFRFRRRSGLAMTSLRTYKTC